MRKLIVTIIVCYAFLMATNYLVHGVLLMPDYNAIPASHRSPDEINSKLWILAIGQMFFAAMFVYIYTRGVEKKPWPAQGLRYGVLMSLLAVVPYSLTQYDNYVVPYTLVVKWIVLDGIQVVLLGLIVAAIYKPQSA